MKISPTSWHYRLYCYMSQAYASWTHENDYWEYPKNTAFLGLCPYMRMILIWGPIAILSNLVPIYAVIAALVLFPAGASGWVGIAWLFGSAALIAGLIVLGAYLFDKGAERRAAKKESQLNNMDEEEKPAGFIKLMYTWIHDSICPKLELPQNDD